MVYATDSELFYGNVDKLLAVPNRVGASGQPRTVLSGEGFPSDLESVGGRGERLCFRRRLGFQTRGRSSMMLRAPAAINVVINWFDELEQLVPIED